MRFIKSEGSFVGSAIHELVHVSVFQDPEYLNIWVNVFGNPQPNKQIGSDYSWWVIDYTYGYGTDRSIRAKQEEMMAIYTAVSVTGWSDRNLFLPYRLPWDR